MGKIQYLKLNVQVPHLGKIRLRLIVPEKKNLATSSQRYKFTLGSEDWQRQQRKSENVTLTENIFSNSCSFHGSNTAV